MRSPRFRLLPLLGLIALFGVCCSETASTTAGTEPIPEAGGTAAASAGAAGTPTAPPSQSSSSSAAGAPAEGGAAASGPAEGGTSSAGGSSAADGGAQSAGECASDLTLARHDIDDAFTGENKALGDVDGDGLLDAIVGGHVLKWYAAPHWTPHEIASADTQFMGHMQAADIDGDAAVDIITPDGDYVYWYENPKGSGGDPTKPWKRHLVGNQYFWTHELVITDLNLDGKPDIVTNTNLNLWLQGETPTVWQLVELHAFSDAEGLTVGDVDGDGRPDLVVRGFWVHTPKDPSNPDAYEPHEFDDALSDSVVLRVADIDENGKPDIVVAPKEDNISEIDWYSADDPSGKWTKHTVGPAGFAHEFAVVDFDGQGRPDIVFAEMSPSPTKRVGAYLQQPDRTWEYYPIATTGSHNIVVGDLGNDCDYDILGANWEAPPVQIWENKLCDGSGRTCAPKIAE